MVMVMVLVRSSAKLCAGKLAMAVRRCPVLWVTDGEGVKKRVLN